MAMTELIRNMDCKGSDYLLRPGYHGVPPSVLEIIIFSFTCFTVPLHIIVLIFIGIEVRSNRRINNAFYIICLCLGIIDVTCLVNSVIFYSFPRWGYFRHTIVELGPFLLRFGFFTSWGLGLSQVCFTLLMTVNRYTALIHAPRHNEIWSYKNLVTLIVVIFVFACLLGFIMYLSPVCFVESSEGELLGRITNNFVLKSMYCIVGVFLIGSTCIMLILYSVIFKVLLKRKQAQQKLIIMGKNFLVKAVIQRKREKKLLIMSICVCTIQLFITCFVITKSLFDYIDPQNVVYNQLNTLYSMSNSYLLIIFSDVIRKRLKILFFQHLLPTAKVHTTTYLIHYSRKI